MSGTAPATPTPADGRAAPRVPVRVHLALVVVQVLFGGFHVTAKAVLDTLHPFALAGLRVLFATPLLLLVAWGFARRSGGRVIPRLRDLPWLAALGLLGVCANQLLFILGLEDTSATNAAILMPSIPVFALALAVVFGVERLTAARGLGVALAVAGALVMLDPGRFGAAATDGGAAAATDGGAAASNPLRGNLLVLANCLSYAAFLVLQRPVLRRLPAPTVIAWSFVFGSVGVLAVGWPHVVALTPAAWSPAVWFGLGYIILLATTTNYALNTWAISRSTPSLAATYTTLQPLTAGALAAVFLGEAAGWHQLVGFALIVAGLQRVSRRGQPR